MSSWIQIILLGAAGSLLAAFLIAGSRYVVHVLTQRIFRTLDNAPLPFESSPPPVEALKAFLTAFQFATLSLGLAMLVLLGVLAFRGSPHIASPLLVYGTIPVVFFAVLAVARIMKFRRIHRSTDDGLSWKIELQ